MPTYHDIDALLLTVNRGGHASGVPARGENPVAAPGDTVAVSRLDGRPVTILVHRIDRNSSTCFGQLQVDISVDGRIDVGEGTLVSFSPGKIAGIHR